MFYMHRTLNFDISSSNEMFASSTLLAFCWKSNWVWIKEHESNAILPFRHVRLEASGSKIKACLLFLGVYVWADRISPPMRKKQLFSKDVARENPCCNARTHRVNQLFCSGLLSPSFMVTVSSTQSLPLTWVLLPWGVYLGSGEAGRGIWFNIPPPF